MKKWIIRILLLQVLLIGVLVALPVVLPIREEYRPRPVVRVDSAMRKQVIAPAEALKVAKAHLLSGDARAAGTRLALPQL